MDDAEMERICGFVNGEDGLVWINLQGITNLMGEFDQPRSSVLLTPEQAIALAGALQACSILVQRDSILARMEASYEATRKAN